MFFACGIWCLADVLSISPSSEQTEGLWGNHYLGTNDYHAAGFPKILSIYLRVH